MIPDLSGQRLITQNLIADAARFETSETLDLNSISELSKFIDIFCLYDNVTVLGRQAYSMIRRDSEFIDALDQIVEVKKFVDKAKVIDVASAHLGMYLDDKERDNLWKSRLFEAVLSPDAVARSYEPSPDSASDLGLGDLWLKTLPTNADVVVELKKERDGHRGATFLIRSFLYLAYSDVTGLPFTPDAVRGVVLEKVIRKEQVLRSKLIAKLRESGSQGVMGNDTDLTRRISPLASIVYERAWPKKQNIVSEMVALRKELKSLRERLRSIEQDLLVGKAQTEKRLSRKWDSVFGELEKTFGEGQGLVTRSGALTLAESASKVLEEPHKTSGWVKALLGLPVEMIERMLARRPLVELYQFKNQIPSSLKLKRNVSRLFGDQIYSRGSE